MEILRKALFSGQGWKQMLNFYDEHGNFSWQQVGQTAIQLAFFVALYLIADWTGYGFGVFT